MVSPIFYLFNHKTEKKIFFFCYFLHFLLDLFISVLGLALQGFISIYYLNSISVFKEELKLDINEHLGQEPHKTKK